MAHVASFPGPRPPSRHSPYERLGKGWERGDGSCTSCPKSVVTMVTCFHSAKQFFLSKISNMLRASCLMLEIKEFRCYETKIEYSTHRGL